MNLPSDKYFAGLNIIFGEGGEAPSTTWSQDIVVLGTFTNRCYERLKINYQPPSWHIFLPVFGQMSSILRKNTSISSPSIFKRCAAFTIAFMEVSPLTTTFHEKISDDLTKCNNHQNAIVAFAYVRQCLHKARFGHDGRTIELSNKIKISRHYYCDLIHAISSIDGSPSDFHLLSLIYESLSYEANKGASDEKTI